MKKSAAALLHLLAGLVVSGLAMATPDPASILAAAGGDDESLKLIQTVFGNPGGLFPSAGGPMPGGEIFSSIFENLNVILLTLGLAWMTYGVVAGLVQTAHEGEFLGKRMSSTWIPIRLTIGIVTLVPFVKGWSIAQLFIYLMAVLGIGAANLTVQGFAGSVNQLSASATPYMPPASKAVDPKTREAVEKMLKVAACVESHNFELAAGEANGALQYEQQQYATCQKTAGRMVCGITAELPDEFACGSISFPTAKATDNRNSDPAMASIAAAVAAGQEAAGLEAFQQTRTLARELAQAAATGADFTGVGKRVDDIAKAYQAGLTQAVAAHESQIQQRASEALAKAGSMEKGGWVSLGSSYKTLSSDLTAFSQMGLGVAEVQIEEGRAQGEFMARLSGAWSGMEDFSDRLTGEGETWRWLSNKINGGIASIGNDGGLVNPLVVAQKLGDTTLGAGQALFLVSKIPLVGKVLDKIPGADSLSTVGMVLFWTGAFLSIYVPMIPFIAFWSGIITWLGTLAEGLVAAPLWSIAHLDTDGEGLGRRTEYGYIFIMQVFLRPVLMVIGFIVASLSMLALGTLFVKLYGMAWETAGYQNTDMGAVVLLVGGVVLFGVVLISIVQGSFALVSYIPDKVLGWLGSHIGEGLGRQQEVQHEGKFQSAVLAGKAAAKL
ncbi:MAG: hypothetical protein ABS92_03880 [Thiobacillus sp. SCN 63-374]|nr:MAG: hypothetical protein ABS92_03880 [Thiobacillus sp. SCN 63-374]